MTFNGWLRGLIYYGLESMGKFYSSYRGYTVDNNDPDNLGRIKVKVPQVTGDEVHSKWAYPKHNFSGKNYGLQVLPQIGDVVWVEFEHGHASFPIWSHGHWAKDEKPEEFSSANIYGFKSPKGHLVVIDDDNDQMIINGVGEIIFNGGENEGLVKVIELTEKLNDIEDKVNDFLTHYQSHMVVDPISGTAGPLMPSPPAPGQLTKTQQADIENDKILH